MFQQQQQSTAPSAFAAGAQTSTGMPYPKETKFMDLPLEIRQAIESLHKTVTGYSDSSAFLQNRECSRVEHLSSALRALEAKMAAFEVLYTQNSGRMVKAKRTMHQYWKYAEAVARAIKSAKAATPESRSVVPAFIPQDMRFLDDIVAAMEVRIFELQRLAEEVKRTLEMLQQNSTFTPKALRNAIKFQNDVFMGVGNRYAQLHYDVEKLRDAYRAFCIKYRHDYRDPFQSRGGGVEGKKDDESFAPPPAPATSSGFSLPANQAQNPVQGLMQTPNPTAPLFGARSVFSTPAAMQPGSQPPPPQPQFTFGFR